MITSTDNKKISHILKLKDKKSERVDSNGFVIEGIKLFLEAPLELCQEVFVSESLQKDTKRFSLVEEKLKQTGYEIVKDSLFQKISDTKTPQGIVAILKRLDYSIEDLLKKENPFVIVLEQINDPGNLGTILRTAEASAAAGIILTENSVDIYNPKVVRATMGAIFRVPFIYSRNIVSIVELLRKQPFKIYAAALENSKSYDEVNYLEACAVMIGNEANGLSKEALVLADEKIHIPMEGKGESLNAGVAGAIIMYECARQKRTS